MRPDGIEPPPFAVYDVALPLSYGRLLQHQYLLVQVANTPIYYTLRKYSFSANLNRKLTESVVGAVDDPAMFAHDLTFRGDDDVVGIDPQAHRSIGKGGWNTR